MLLHLIDLFNCIENQARHAIVLHGAHERLDVFWKAAASIASSSLQKSRAYPAIKPHPPRNVFHVCSYLLAQLRNLVHKRYPCCKHCVACVLYHFRCPDVGEKDWLVCPYNACIQLLHRLSCPLACGADHNPVRVEKIIDCFAFPQKFGIGHHVKINCGFPVLPDGVGNEVSCPHGNGTLGYNHLIAIYSLPYLLCCGKDVPEVSTLILARRCANGDEDDLS